MNSLLKLKVESVTKQFNNALEEGLSKYAPRNGFYFVKAFDFRSIQNQTYPFIVANWKANLEDLFVAEATFEVALSSLHAADSNTQMDYSTITGKTLQVFRVSKHMSSDKGKAKVVVHGLWMYEHSEPKFLDGVALLFSAIAADTTRLDDGTVVITSEEKNGIDYDMLIGVEQDLSFEEGDPENLQDLEHLEDGAETGEGRAAN